MQWRATFANIYNYHLLMCSSSRTKYPLQWRHNGRDCVSNHQPNVCLLNRLFTRDQRKHKSSTSLAFVVGIQRWPVNSPHKGPVTRKNFHLMTSSWFVYGLSICESILNIPKFSKLTKFWGPGQRFLSKVSPEIEYVFKRAKSIPCILIFWSSGDHRYRISVVHNHTCLIPDVDLGCGVEWLVLVNVMVIYET